jgi:ribosome-associated protein
MLKAERAELLINECQMKTSRSGGKGGQNVNKVESRVKLTFCVDDSAVLTEEEKERLQKKAGSRIRSVSGTERTQLANRKAAAARLIEKVNAMLARRKKRKPTGPTRASKERRKDDKRRQSEKKSMRGRPKE